MYKIAIILSGCGVYDGSEIHEAVCSMLAIEQNKGSYTLFAPDKAQAHVINHLTGEVMNESRNVLTEAARIARGKIQNISELNESDFDAILLPGGYGAAKNLSNYAFEGKDMTVDTDVDRILNAFLIANKPIGALCISPVILAKLFQNIRVTIGTDPETIGAIEFFGSKHIETSNEDVIVDTENKIVTGPCYMLNATISEIASNTNKVVKALISLIE